MRIYSTTVMRVQAWPHALALAALLWLLQMGGSNVQTALRFSRHALEQGEWWRLFSGNFVHLGWPHTALNIVGVLLCCAFAPQLFNRHVWLKTAGLALGVGVLLWWFSPNVSYYVGLSGVLYGLFGLGLLPQAWRGDRFATLALVVTVTWILWQWAMGPATSEENLIGGRIATVAHLYGFCLGVGSVALSAVFRRLKISK